MLKKRKDGREKIRRKIYGGKRESKVMKLKYNCGCYRLVIETDLHYTFIRLS